VQRGHDSATSGSPLGKAPTDLKRAPDDLEVLRGFVNTEGRFYGIDLLRDEQRRPHLSGILLPGVDLEAVDARGRARLAQLRDALRGLVARDDGAEEAFNRVAARVPVRVRVDTTGGSGTTTRLVAAEPGPEHDLAAAVLSALQVALHDGRFDRLRLCERAECGWCYYDGTKNRSGRWCSTDPCGDIMKARAFRARQRAAG